MNHQLKNTLQSIAVVVTAALPALGAYAAEKVTLAAEAFPSAQVKVSLLKQLIEQRLGVEVQTATGDHAIFYAGMDRGRGDIDVHPNVWLPNQDNFKAEYVDEKGTVVYSEKSHAGTQGFCVPREFSEEHNVKSTLDLARPDIAALLDSDGDGKGEIWVGQSGWASTNENHVKLRDYGLLAFNEALKATAAVNTAKLDDAIKKGRGHAFYCWKPNIIWNQFDVVQLSEPPHDPSCHNIIPANEDPNWFENSKVTCASPSRNVLIGWSKSLDERLPAVTALLSEVDWNADMISELAYKIGVEKRDPDEVADEWIAANEDVVDGWFGLR